VLHAGGDLLEGCAPGLEVSVGSLAAMSPTVNLDPACLKQRGEAAGRTRDHTWGYGGLATRRSSSNGARAPRRAAPR
jgi:hypothetical protein